LSYEWVVCLILRLSWSKSLTGIGWSILEKSVVNHVDMVRLEPRLTLFTPWCR